MNEREIIAKYLDAQFEKVSRDDVSLFVAALNVISGVQWVVRCLNNTLTETDFKPELSLDEFIATVNLPTFNIDLSEKVATKEKLGG